ncbi:hypothetical protein ACLQ2Y_11415 [Micromonospora echinospora]|uniref:PIN domain-containing protein n=1 Tax=Micromonospora echinospora TaxID=1877 RepID=A0ABR6M6K7_MICEC|nr:hypothetical protein [Micromonospora echinospora]
MYFDSDAVVKLARQEVCSADLVSWLDKHDDGPLVPSALVEVEVLRSAAPISSASYRSP